MTAAYWRRRGEEAETEDFRAGNPPCTDEGEVYSALAAHFDGDLSLDEAEREEALGAAVGGATSRRRGPDSPQLTAHPDDGAGVGALEEACRTL